MDKITKIAKELKDMGLTKITISQIPTNNKITSEHFGKLCNSKTKPFKNTLIGRMTCLADCNNCKGLDYVNSAFIICSDSKNAVKDK